MEPNETDALCDMNREMHDLTKLVAQSFPEVEQSGAMLGEENDEVDILNSMSGGHGRNSRGSSTLRGEEERTVSVVGTVSSTARGRGSTQSSSEDALDQWLVNGDPVQVTLAMNYAYQELVDNLIQRVERALASVRQKIHLVESRREHQRSSQTAKARKKVPVLQFLPPYFKDSAGMAPLHNLDKLRKMDTGEFDPLVKESKKWTASECRILEKAVHDSLIDDSTLTYRNQLDLLFDKLKMAGQHTSKDDIAEWKEKAKELQKEITYLKNIPSEKVFEEGNYDAIDWLKISTYNMKTTRSPNQCRVKWLTDLNPRWSREQWNEMEMKNLNELVSNEDHVDWDDVAEELDTNRTAFQCFEKYQSTLNDSLLKKKWTPEEDEVLRQVVAGLTDPNGGAILWDQVCYYMEGRTKQQCMIRWRRSLDDGTIKGAWTDEEDLLLMCAVGRYGARDWQKVARLVQGRTDGQCRERWCNVLDEGNKDNEWTPEEDELLLFGVQTFGQGQWAQVSKIIPGRTAPSCRHRLQTLITSKIRKEENASEDLAIKAAVTASKVRAEKFADRRRRVRERFRQLIGAIDDDDDALLPSTSNAIGVEEFIDSLPRETRESVREAIATIRERHSTAATNIADESNRSELAEQVLSKLDVDQSMKDELQRKLEKRRDGRRREKTLRPLSENSENDM